MIAAEKSTAGLAVVVDLWKRGDQFGQFNQGTQKSAVAEGVNDRVELRTADMTDLSFEIKTFVLVVSNLTIYKVKRDGHNKAIEETIRALQLLGAHE